MATTISTTGAQIGRDLHVGGDLNLNVCGSSSNQHCDPITTLPPCRSPPPLFTGRGEFLQKLDKLIKKSEINETGAGGGLSNRMTVIVGLGGIGKSCTAMTYATTYTKEHDTKEVAWIEADSEKSLLDSFKGIARHFKICPDILNRSPQQQDGAQSEEERAADVAALVSQVYRHFSTHVQKGLFIFDNAHQLRSTRDEDECGILNFLTNEQLPNYPTILITSRNRNWGVAGNEIQRIELTDLDHQESITFFKKSFKIHSPPPPALLLENDMGLKNALSKLADLLGGFPLALSLAASNISEEMACRPTSELGSEVEAYIDIFEKNAKTWVTMDFSRDSLEPYKKIMATVWTATVDKIRRRGTVVSEMSLVLLKIISYLPNTKISFKFVRCLNENISPSRLDENSGSEATRNVRRGLDLLQKYSMIQHMGPFSFGPEWAYQPFPELCLFNGDTSGKIRIHRLVQLWTREDLHMRGEFGTLLGLAEYYKNWRSESTSLRFCFDPIQKFLRECGWPEGSYGYPIFDAIRQHEKMERYEDTGRSMKLLMETFKFLGAQPSNERDAESYDCVRMGLVYFYHKQKFLKGLNFRMEGSEEALDLEEVLDNCGIFEKWDFLQNITVAKFLDWVCATLILYEGNPLMNELGRHILFPLHVYEDERRWRGLDEMYRFKFPAWIISFSAAMKHGGVEHWGWHLTYAHKFFRMADRAGIPHIQILGMILQVYSSAAYCKYASDRPRAWSFLATSMEPIVLTKSLESIVSPDCAMKTELLQALTRATNFVIYTINDGLEGKKYFDPDVCHPFTEIIKILLPMTEQIAEFILRDFELTKICAKLFHPFSLIHPNKSWQGDIAVSWKPWRNLAILCVAICKFLSNQPGNLDSSNLFYPLLEEIRSNSEQLISALDRRSNCSVRLCLYFSPTFRHLSFQLLTELLDTHPRRVMGPFFDLLQKLLPLIREAENVSFEDMHRQVALNDKFKFSEHLGVECSSCEAYPIAGTRFKCKTCPHFDLCRPCHHRNVHEHNDFWEILSSDPSVPYQKLTWVAAKKGHIPVGSLIGGEEGGEPLFVARATDNDNLIPGKVSSSGCGFVIFRQRKSPIVTHTFEILVISPNEVSWLPMADGAQMMPGAIPGGMSTMVNSIYYIGRVHHEGHLIVGYVLFQGAGGAGYISIHFDNKLVTYKEYELLVFASAHRPDPLSVTNSATPSRHQNHLAMLTRTPQEWALELEGHVATLISKSFPMSEAKFALQVCSCNFERALQFLKKHWTPERLPALCDGCGRGLTRDTIRFKCQECADFDFCGHCKTNVTTSHSHKKFWKIIPWRHHQEEKKGNSDSFNEESLEWVAAEGGQFPPEGVVAGLRNGGQQVVVGRVKLFNEIIPGEVTMGDKGCRISYGGHGASIESYEVLVIPINEVSWTPSVNGHILPNGVVGGMSRRRELLFIGRLELEMTFGRQREKKLVVGRIQPSRKALILPSDMGKELEFQKYEQLTYNNF